MSKITKPDAATTESYLIDGFDPAVDTEKFSYTAARVAKPVYNKYNTVGRPKVFGYYTDWSQYDGRLQGSQQPADRGRGVDLALVSPTAFDKLIVGFVGILGDLGEKSAAISSGAAAFGIHDQDGSVTFLDVWGDTQTYVNNGFPSYKDITMPDDFQQEKVQGILGGLRDLQKKAKTLGHDLVLSFSVGGWTMSNGFYNMSRDAQQRVRFCASIVDIFKRFPMFTEVDIDWEYPGAAGNNNPYGDDDSVYYVILMRELRAAFNNAGLPNTRISIASSADPAVLAKADIPGLLAAGLNGINVMTYDFFGTPWAPALNHHTNLHKTEQTSYGVDAAVDYLISIGVAQSNINIGYAGYTRNARNAGISQLSPLVGTYEPGAATTTGTFESGSSEWYDIIYNYLDLEAQKGKNGFELYTDEKADADYLYSSSSKLFISLDTPRTVKAKAEYARSKGLGGVFTWTADQDNGLLVNAAREGLGAPIVTQAIDMAPFYFKGINASVDPLDRAPVAQIVGPKSPVSPITQLTFDGSHSYDPDGDPITYQWNVPSGLIVSGSLTDPIIHLRVPAAGYQASYTVSLTVSDGSKTGTDTYTFLVAGGVNEPPVAAVSGSKTVSSGATGTLSAANSYDPDGEVLSYFWSLPADVTATSVTGETLTYTAPTVLINHSLVFQLTVTDISGASDTAAYNVTVQAATGYPQWSATETYNEGDRVSWEGSNYEAKWWTQGTEPGTLDEAGGDPWFKLGSGNVGGQPNCPGVRGGCCAPRGRNPGRNM
ncbi:glycoside hydrolase family 18 protein [Rahnella perminowiae]|uniref:glycoside hydrolase family 18 protein n=1 Tax=Rahnella perminowiae TaxID=2816244 RepID=UPI00215CE83B|nr:glycosyl hydrolase family 18 protein [Rahnella perminowiae]MCR9000926.1 glycosyl hydrolase family 18 protein [Rahnella perminowiae]